MVGRPRLLNPQFLARHVRNVRQLEVVLEPWLPSEAERTELTSPASSRSDGIVRMPLPDRAWFERELVGNNRPAVFPGGAADWPAVARWGPSYFTRVAGKAQITTRFEPDAEHVRYYTPAGGVDAVMSFAEYNAKLTATPPDNRYYLAPMRVPATFPMLLEDCDCSAVSDTREAALFYGRDVFSPTHYHGDEEGVLCQIFGTKRIVLFPPGQSRLLYPFPWYTHVLNFSRVDPRAPDRASFPRFADATPIVVDMRPGDMIYVPVHWWHAVESPGLSCAISFFWKARLRDWRYPRPGLAVHAHAWLSPMMVRSRLQRLARWFRRQRS
ncbi:MAG: cupin-like domain-containing protein [Planctomycetota bacterium]